MFELSRYAFVASIAALGGGLVLYIATALAGQSWSARVFSVAGGGTLGTSANTGLRSTLGRYATMLTVNAFIFMTASLAFRAIEAGHGPFSNMYEFSLAFAWGAVAIYLFFEFKYHTRALSLLVVPVAFGLLLYATTVPDDIAPLVPALQNDLLLTVHVAVAIIAYGAFTVAFGAAVLYLLQRGGNFAWLPNRPLLDEIGYKSVMFGFPLLALVIILGAVWAEIAWGQYWSWDPKETSSLVTWLIYGGYLHARVMRGWRGERSAWLLVLGFSSTLFTYFGNLFFGGLHSYA